MEAEWTIGTLVLWVGAALYGCQVVLVVAWLLADTGVVRAMRRQPGRWWVLAVPALVLPVVLLLALWSGYRPAMEAGK